MSVSLIKPLLFVIGFSLLAACEDNTPHINKKVGIILFGDSRQPQVDGFIDGLKNLGYTPDQNIHYIIKNAKNDRKKIAPLITELINQKIDLLVTAGGLEADTAKQLVAGKGIPVVVLYINAIKERKLIADPLNPGWNVTGIDNLNAELSSKRIELLHNLAPKAKKVLVLYYARIAPSRIGLVHAQKTANKLGLLIDARAVNSRNEIQLTMNSLKTGDVDAMLTVPTAPIDNALVDIILPEVKRLKIPLFTHSCTLTEKGALAGYGSSFYDMGDQAARMADKIFKGIEAKKIPFEIPKKFTYCINSQRQKQLNLNISDLSKAQINSFIGKQ